MATRKKKAATPNLICMMEPVTVKAAETGEDGAIKSPPAFNVVAYTGGMLTLGGWDLPVVLDLKGMSFSNSLVANLDHEQDQPVGNVTGTEKTESTLTLSGTATAATDATRIVVDSARNGFQWQASIEARPDSRQEIEVGKKVAVNGQEFEGPFHLIRQSTLKGFAFLGHGADDNTTVQIAAKADTTPVRNKTMKAECKTWIEAELGLVVDDLNADQIAGLEANYEGRQKPKTTLSKSLGEGTEAIRIESERVEAITEIALKACASRPHEIDGIKLLASTAIDNKHAVDRFRLDLLEAGVPGAQTIWSTQRDSGMNNRLLEAAVCVAGGLKDVEKRFDDQTLQAAHDKFKGRIGLNQLFIIGAEANGYRGNNGSKIDVEAQRAAFGMQAPAQIRAAGFSNIDIPTILSNVANLFIRVGWNAVDMTPLAIAPVRNVSDFKEISTASLTGDLEFLKVGPAGEIKHGDLGETTYGNKADTYARMLAITRTDFINDSLNALSSVPQKLGRGAGLMLNKIFWTEFLDNSTFFVAGNNNISTGALSEVSLDAANTVFMNQTDPDGNPLLASAMTLLVPTGVESTALRLMNSELVVGNSDRPDANIWRNRFNVESSPYMSNALFTGNSAVAWYLLGDKDTLPVIEIAALNGRVEPVVESADAEFNVLGVEMRGYSDVGVRLQEFRGGVRSTGA